jgi:MtN3 and saliva related transmembrane protein
MEMNWNTEIIGIIAGFLTTICYIPQVIKIVTTNQTKDISMPTYIVLTIGIIFWLIYGVFKNSISIILANVSALILVMLIIALKIKNER